MVAERYFTARGWKVINPATLDPKDMAYDGESIPELDELRRFLMRDFKYLLYCDAVVLLDGWWRSRGANAELAVARLAGVPVYRFACYGDGDYWLTTEAMPRLEVLREVMGVKE